MVNFIDGVQNTYPCDIKIEEDWAFFLFPSPQLLNSNIMIRSTMKLATRKIITLPRLSPTHTSARLIKRLVRTRSHVIEYQPIMHLQCSSDLIGEYIVGQRSFCINIGFLTIVPPTKFISITILIFFYLVNTKFINTKMKSQSRPSRQNVS